MARLSHFTDGLYGQQSYPVDQPKHVILGYQEGDSFAYRTAELRQLLGQVDQQWQDHLYPLAREINSTYIGVSYGDRALRDIIRMRSRVTCALFALHNLPTWSVPIANRDSEATQAAENQARAMIASVARFLHKCSSQARWAKENQYENRDTGKLYFSDNNPIAQAFSSPREEGTSPSPETILTDITLFGMGIVVEALRTEEHDIHPIQKRSVLAAQLDEQRTGGTEIFRSIFPSISLDNAAKPLSDKDILQLVRLRKSFKTFLLGTRPEQWTTESNELLMDANLTWMRIIASRSR